MDCIGLWTLCQIWLRLLARRDSTIAIHTYGYSLQRTIGGPLNGSSVVSGIKDRTVSRVDELMRAVIVIYINAFVCAGSLVGNKFTAQQMDEDTTVAIGRVGEVGA